ncbi:hypothetical protein ACFQHV_08030 [Promicromonospora thailandica]|uniref:Sporulation protein YtfJ (Spore_YtfJ) n=1 Tax=Promicromonospora thailandica TaxID=765201 RepID=A0A9X2FZI3_9MICO|nr:hypothetical protein [Promicromonospora thailandica]MCP2264044.1 Sporulation protein YtfJ (Spore_YtfJ) [Promicromonospora thailandica]
MRYIPDLRRISEAAAESFGVRQVYGEPVERDGVVVVPAVRVVSGGGAGGGGGSDAGSAAGPAAEPGAEPDDAEAPAADGAPAGDEPRPPAEGGGGGVGFGRRAEPAGAFVLDDRGVRWVPALDVNRIVLGGQVAFVLAAVVVGWALTRRRR